MRRKHLWEDTLKALKRTLWAAAKHLKVVFLGEPGIDDGGPRREFFRLLLAEIGRNNMLFKGPHERRVPAHNVLAMQDELFFHVGQIMAMSMVHDGPCVHWLAPPVVCYLLECDATGCVDDIPDDDIVAKVKAVRVTNRITYFTCNCPS